MLFVYMLTSDPVESVIKTALDDTDQTTSKGNMTEYLHGDQSQTKNIQGTIPR